jgi:hypothetical protein
MAIGNAVEKAGWIYVYDEKGGQTAKISAGMGFPGDGLKGYTATTVNVQRAGWILTYDAKGNQKSKVSAP